MILGTRGSELALWQARYVQAALGGETAGVQLQIIKTQGDLLLNLPLQNQADKGFFTKELEVALADRRIDLAVHSLKDLPTAMPPGLALAAIPPRADVGDVLFVRPQAHDPTQPMALRPGSRVGTASNRRTALLRTLAPHVQAEFLRGNVPTRLGKVLSGALDAAILARAGVARLNLPHPGVLAFDLDPQVWLPAPGQAALGVQARADDAAVLKRLAVLHDPTTAACVDIERRLLQRTEGGCHAAFGAWASLQGEQATVDAGWEREGQWQQVRVTAPARQVVELTFERLLANAQGRDMSERAWCVPAHPWC
jgi:hydroxymethylbilane synthase